MGTTLAILAKITMLGPLFVLGIMILLAIIYSKSHPDVIENVFGKLTSLTSLFLLAISIYMIMLHRESVKFSLWGMAFHLDALSIFTLLLINVVAFAASWNAIFYLSHNPSNERPWWQQGWMFHILIHLFHFTMLLVPLTDNLVIAWVAIELTTLGSALLIIYEDKPSAWEATWKYLVVTSAGIVLALLGTIFLANSLPPNLIQQHPSNSLLNWTYLISQKDSLNKQFVWFAFLFSLAGYGTKAGLSPLHTWLPDGHGEAPSPVSALLSGVLLKASFYVILRFFILTNAVLGTRFQHWTYLAFLIVGLISLVTSTPLILRPKTPFKRVLAYHSLEHMGIIIFGFGMGGFVTVVGAILHMFNHAITKALMFLAYGNLLKHYSKNGIPITGALRIMPWSSGMLILGGLALVGTPPFNVFMSELLILWGTIERFFLKGVYPPYSVSFIVGAISLFVLTTTLIFFGLINHLRKIALGKPKSEVPQEQFSLSAIGPLLFLFLVMLFFGVWIIPPISQIVHESAKIVLSMR